MVLDWILMDLALQGISSPSLWLCGLCSLFLFVVCLFICYFFNTLLERFSLSANHNVTSYLLKQVHLVSNPSVCTDVTCKYNHFGLGLGLGLGLAASCICQ